MDIDWAQVVQQSMRMVKSLNIGYGLLSGECVTECSELSHRSAATIDNFFRNRFHFTVPIRFQVVCRPFRLVAKRPARDFNRQ